MTCWRWAGLAALATLAAIVGFGFVPGNDACRATAGMQPWGAFQKIASVAEAQSFLIGACPRALRIGMWFDALVFIPVYAAFLLLTTRAAHARHLLWLAFGALLTVGIIADEVEGARLLGIIGAQGGTAAMIAAANKATWAKELFLALATVPVGLAVMASGGWRRVAGAVAAASAAIAAVAEVHGQTSTLALGIAWLTLAVTTWIMAFRTRAA